MQIKRFEATDMAEALRMVKRELGDDAVILSAKEVRPGGFFSALRQKHVEITAAADYPMDNGQADSEFSGLLSQHLDVESETDRVSLSSPLTAIRPFPQKTRPSPHQPTAPENHIAAPVRMDSRQGQIPHPLTSSQEKKIDHTAGVTSGTGEASIAELNQYLMDNHLVAEPFYLGAERRKIIALVGPAGAGKSTTVAKLARHCLEIEKKRTGLISLDRFRIGANGMLENVARIMNMPFMIVHDADGLQSALNDLADVDVVLIDTPGMGSRDPSMMDDVCVLLRTIVVDEIHLVANAAMREDVLAATVKTFQPFNINRLLFTHMDEYGLNTAVLNMMKETRIASSFYGDGVDIFDDLQETTSAGLAGFFPHRESSSGQVTVFPGKREHLDTNSLLNAGGGESMKYVANRNSELFHHPNCKSVKRINAENIAAFNSIEQAMEEGFKPCRACCDPSMIRKSVPGALGHQRVSAI